MRGVCYQICDVSKGSAVAWARVQTGNGTHSTCELIQVSCQASCVGGYHMSVCVCVNERGGER